MIPNITIDPTTIRIIIPVLPILLELSSFSVFFIILKSLSFGLSATLFSDELQVTSKSPDEILRKIKYSL